MAFITTIETAFPPHRATMEDSRNLLAPFFTAAGDKPELVDGVFANARVDQRFLARPTEFYFEHRDLTTRNRVYAEVAQELGQEVVAKALKSANITADSVDLIIGTSCTGLMIPSLDAYLVNSMGMRRDIRRMPMNSVGCAGGAVAVSRAHDYLKAYPQANVLIVAFELPSLTVQFGDTSRANLVSSAIFGDGAAAVVMQGRKPEQKSYEVLATRSILFPDSTSVMGFDLRTEGLHIVLSRRIPLLVKKYLRAEVDEFLAEHGKTIADLDFYALHPGGTKVLDNLRNVFETEEEKVAASRNCLARYGNLSSASVLTVAKELTDTNGYEDQQLGILCAMGPGFALEMSLIRGHVPAN